MFKITLCWILEQWDRQSTLGHEDGKSLFQGKSKKWHPHDATLKRR